MLLLTQSSFVMKQNCYNLIVVLFSFFLSFYNLMLPTIQTLHLNIRIFLTPELYIMSKGKNEDILVSTPDPECFLGKQIPILPSLLSVFLFISTSITSYCLTALLSHAQMLKDGVNL